MTVVVSAAELTRVRVCIIPGCPREATRPMLGSRIRDGLGVCDECWSSIPARHRRALAQRAEMRRQAGVDMERRNGREFALRRERKRRIVDGRMRVLVTLERLHAQAVHRRDDELARAVAEARSSVVAALGIEVDGEEAA